MTVIEEADGRYTVSGQVSPATITVVTAFCADADAEVTDLRLGRRTLDEVYLALTGHEVRS